MKRLGWGGPCTVALCWVVAIACTATALAVAPASADSGQSGATPDMTATAATLEASAPVRTYLTLSAPPTIRAKESTTVVARLTDVSGTPVPGVPVRIMRLSGTRAKIGSGLTDSRGRFSVKVTPQATLVLSAICAGDALHAGSRSAAVTIHPKVLFSAPWTHDRYAYPGQRLPARGTLWPKHSKYSKATVIVCLRWEGGAWVKRAQYQARIANTETSSRYDAVIRLPSSGYWRVRAVHSDGDHARTLGSVTKIKVTDWRRRYRGKKLGGFKSTRKVVAITIDDGPNSRTLDVCSILERYGARGTFFFTDSLLDRGFEGQAKAAYNRGHEIANHTAHHRMLYGYSDSLREVTIPKTSIRAATGFSPTWVRAMGGGVDSAGMRAVVDSGQLYCNWSLDSYDSHAMYTPPSTLYSIVMRGVNPGDVILIHQTHPETIKALPSICRELKRRGYKMVTLSELAATSKAR